MARSISTRDIVVYFLSALLIAFQGLLEARDSEADFQSMPEGSFNDWPLDIFLKLFYPIFGLLLLQKFGE